MNRWTFLICIVLAVIYVNGITFKTYNEKEQCAAFYAFQDQWFGDGSFPDSSIMVLSVNESTQNIVPTLNGKGFDLVCKAERQEGRPHSIQYNAAKIFQFDDEVMEKLLASVPQYARYNRYS